MAKVILPARSREFGVGKEMVGSVYLHRNYEILLGERVQIAQRCLPADFEYTVVKFNRKTGALSFVESPDFDTSPEPIVGDVWTVAANARPIFRSRLTDPYIYHHKWLMVADDYSGFDTEESMKRTKVWMAMEGLDKTRIGRLGYWTRVLRVINASC